MSKRFRTLNAMSRRAFVERCALGAFGVSVMSAMNGTRAQAEEPRGPGFGKAKHIIWLRLAGGLSQIDSFDPKPGKSKGPANRSRRRPVSK